MDAFDLLPGSRIRKVRREPRAEVSKSFINAWRKVCADTLKNLKRSGKGRTDLRAIDLKMIVDMETVGSRGFDFELTKLTKGPWQKFYTKEYRNRMCMAGYTKDLVIGSVRGVDSKNQTEQYQNQLKKLYLSEPYTIYIPMVCFETYAADFITAVPDERPLARRTMGGKEYVYTHHHSETVFEDGSTNVYCCWGNFRPTTYMYAADIPGLFNVLLRWITVDNQASYGKHGELPHWHETNEDEVESMGLKWPMV